MNRCVIIGGAQIKNYYDIRKHLRDSDFNIFCDSGLKQLNELNIEPHLIIGDFDSHPNPHLEVETITLPREKDDTDTFFAAKEAIKRNFDEFLLVGVVGQRLDHTLGNISILMMLDSLKKRALILDDYSEMEIVSRNTAYVSDSFSYFSLLNVSGKASGIAIKNAKYPLDNAEILPEYQYGISNEVIPGMAAEISVKEGSLLLIKIF